MFRYLLYFFGEGFGIVGVLRLFKIFGLLVFFIIKVFSLIFFCWFEELMLLVFVVIFCVVWLFIGILFFFFGVISDGVELFCVWSLYLISFVGYVIKEIVKLVLVLVIICCGMVSVV